MNPALTLAEMGLAPCESPENAVLAFLASRSRQPARQLSAPAAEVFKGIRDAVDQLILSVLETRTREDFLRVFAAVFPKYAGITITVAGFSQAVIPPDVVNRMARESICEMEADFRDKALPAFGSAVREQAVFTVWTLRKISDLLIEIAATRPPNQKEDAEYCEQFTFHALRAKFSLDCLVMALRADRPIYPEVMESLKDGLRSMVNAYTWARRGVLIRAPNAELALETAVAEDEEDEELLRSSMLDMAVMLEAEDDAK